MKPEFPIFHWILTLIISPFTGGLIQFIWGEDESQVSLLLDIYPATVSYSFVFSIPAFIVYCILFYFLNKKDIQTGLAKFFLIGLTIMCICLTLLALDRRMVYDIFLAYSTTTAIVGVMLRLRPKETVERGRPD